MSLAEHLTPLAVYAASVAGAVAIVLMMPRRPRAGRLIGAILGAGALGGLWLVTTNAWGLLDANQQPKLMHDLGGVSPGAFVWYFIFSLIAIVAAVRVITHPKPVFSALWFVMVILATSGLLLMLNATFIALALIIIYGGAILVTYMFVIMLAQQSQTESGEDTTQAYDTAAHEPILASVTGFLLLAVLLQVGMVPAAPVEEAAGPTSEYLVEHVLADRKTSAMVDRMNEENIVDRDLVLQQAEQARQVSNVERVGVDLFESHPLGLELAGVILLVALIGAIIIAKKHVYEEDEVIQRHPGAGRGPRKD